MARQTAQGRNVTFCDETRGNEEPSGLNTNSKPAPRCMNGPRVPTPCPVQYNQSYVNPSQMNECPFVCCGSRGQQEYGRSAAPTATAFSIGSLSIKAADTLHLHGRKTLDYRYPPGEQQTVLPPDHAIELKHYPVPQAPPVTRVPPGQGRMYPQQPPPYSPRQRPGPQGSFQPQATSSPLARGGRMRSPYGVRQQSPPPSYGYNQSNFQPQASSSPRPNSTRSVSYGSSYSPQRQRSSSPAPTRSPRRPQSQGTSSRPPTWSDERSPTRPQSQGTSSRPPTWSDERSPTRPQMQGFSSPPPTRNPTRPHSQGPSAPPPTWYAERSPTRPQSQRSSSPSPTRSPEKSHGSPPPNRTRSPQYGNVHNRSASLGKAKSDVLQSLQDIDTQLNIILTKLES